MSELLMMIKVVMMIMMEINYTIPMEARKHLSYNSMFLYQFTSVQLISLLSYKRKFLSQQGSLKSIAGGNPAVHSWVYQYGKDVGVKGALVGKCVGVLIVTHCV